MKLLEVIKGDFAKLATLVRKTKMLNEIVIEKTPVEVQAGCSEILRKRWCLTYN